MFASSVDQVMIGPDALDFDLAAVMYFPTRSAFVAMLFDPEFQSSAPTPLRGTCAAQHVAYCRRSNHRHGYLDSSECTSHSESSGKCSSTSSYFKMRISPAPRSLGSPKPPLNFSHRHPEREAPVSPLGGERPDTHASSWVPSSWAIRFKPLMRALSTESAGASLRSQIMQSSKAC